MLRDAAAMPAAIGLNRGTTCQAMLQCMPQLMRREVSCAAIDFERRRHEPSNAAAMCTAIDSEARHYVPSDVALHIAVDLSEALHAKRCCRQACSHRFEARHPVPSDATAMCAAIDSKRGITSQATLLPRAQPSILK